MPTLTELLAVMPHLGLAGVGCAAVIYIVLHSEFEFRYPRRVQADLSPASTDAASDPLRPRTPTIAPSVLTVDH